MLFFFVGVGVGFLVFGTMVPIASDYLEVIRKKLTERLNGVPDREGWPIFVLRFIALGLLLVAVALSDTVQSFAGWLLMQSNSYVNELLSYVALGLVAGGAISALWVNKSSEGDRRASSLLFVICALSLGGAILLPYYGGLVSRALSFSYGGFSVEFQAADIRARRNSSSHERARLLQNYTTLRALSSFANEKFIEGRVESDKRLCLVLVSSEKDKCVEYRKGADDFLIIYKRFLEPVAAYIKKEISHNTDIGVVKDIARPFSNYLYHAVVSSAESASGKDSQDKGRYFLLCSAEHIESSKLVSLHFYSSVIVRMCNIKEGASRDELGSPIENWSSIRNYDMTYLFLSQIQQFLGNNFVAVRTLQSGVEQIPLSLNLKSFLAHAWVMKGGALEKAYQAVDGYSDQLADRVRRSLKERFIVGVDTCEPDWLVKLTESNKSKAGARRSADASPQTHSDEPLSIEALQASDIKRLELGIALSSSEGGYYFAMNEVLGLEHSGYQSQSSSARYRFESEKSRGLCAVRYFFLDAGSSTERGPNDRGALHWAVLDSLAYLYVAEKSTLPFAHKDFRGVACAKDVFDTAVRSHIEREMRLECSVHSLNDRCRNSRENVAFLDYLRYFSSVNLQDAIDVLTRDHSSSECAANQYLALVRGEKLVE